MSSENLLDMRSNLGSCFSKQTHSVFNGSVPFASPGSQRINHKVPPKTGGTNEQQC